MGYAGTYALSQESNLPENNVIIAISTSSANQMIKKENIDVFLKNDIIELQLWNYEPIVINEIVDFVSLYLTLKDIEDTRIEREIQKVLDKQFIDIALNRLEVFETLEKILNSNV